MYTDGSKVEKRVASAYVCPYGTRGYRLRNVSTIFTVEVEAIHKPLKYVKISSIERLGMLSDHLSVLKAIWSQDYFNYACSHKAQHNVVTPMRSRAYFTIQWSIVIHI